MLGYPTHCGVRFTQDDHSDTVNPHLGCWQGLKSSVKVKATGRRVCCYPPMVLAQIRKSHLLWVD